MSIAITAGYLAIGVVASMLGVCTKTLRRWDKAGTLQPAFRTPVHHRRYDRHVMLRTIQGTVDGNDDMPVAGTTTRAMPRAAIYCRVSSTRQKLDGELERQHATIAAHCDARGYRISAVYKDVGPVITEYLSSWGVGLDVMHPTVVNGTPHAELITDLTAILYSFMGRLYRSRRGCMEPAGEPS